MPVESQVEQRIHQRITARSARRTEEDTPGEEPPRGPQVSGYPVLLILSPEISDADIGRRTLPKWT